MHLANAYKWELARKVQNSFFLLRNKDTDLIMFKNDTTNST